MRLLRRITLAMSVAHSSPANTVVSLEPRHFGMWSRSGSSLSQQNYEAYLRANSRMVGNPSVTRPNDQRRVREGLPFNRDQSRTIV